MSKKDMRKKLQGIALRDSLFKTVPVLVIVVKVHPIYKKRYLQNRKFLVHTDWEIKKGQKVTIQEGKPISKQKSWQVVKVASGQDGSAKKETQ